MRFKIGDRVEEIKCICGHGQYMHEREIQTINPTINPTKTATHNWKIIIDGNGDVTTARLYENDKLEKKSEVKRFQKDEYSQKEAVKAVLEKLYTPTYYSGKVVCVFSDRTPFTVGKVYEIKDGILKNDRGESNPHHMYVKTLDDWNMRYGEGARFIELVE